jgi:hypothetical protein
MTGLGQGHNSSVSLQSLSCLILLYAMTDHATRLQNLTRFINKEQQYDPDPTIPFLILFPRGSVDGKRMTGLLEIKKEEKLFTSGEKRERWTITVDYPNADVYDFSYDTEQEAEEAKIVILTQWKEMIDLKRAYEMVRSRYVDIEEFATFQLRDLKKGQVIVVEQQDEEWYINIKLHSGSIRTKFKTSRAALDAVVDLKGWLMILEGFEESDEKKKSKDEFFSPAPADYGNKDTDDDNDTDEDRDEDEDLQDEDREKEEDDKDIEKEDTEADEDEKNTEEPVPISDDHDAALSVTP